MAPRVLYQKLWDSHVVHTEPDGTSLLYVDRHFLHEVCTPQAFEGLAKAGRLPWRINSNLAVADHNVPTTDRKLGIADLASRTQVDVLARNCEKYGIPSFGMNHPSQGIVHVVGPELGATLPGMSIVCGDSHTSTHGAFGALAIGIGTSDVELVLLSQCLITKPLKPMLVRIGGKLGSGISAKDLALAVIRRLGIGGGREHAIEFAGEVVRDLSMEGRMTLCNMVIEAGARAGIVAVDSTTLKYLEGRPYAPKGAMWEQAVQSWQDLKSDDGAAFDKVVHIDGSSVAPSVTWGTVPDMSVDIDGVLPDPTAEPDPQRRSLFERAYQYMGLVPGIQITHVSIDRVFIGSCTNGRIEDLRAAAAVIKGRRVASTIKQAMVVPGSTSVRRQAESEGLDRIFRDAGFEWREAGCSMCLGMNGDSLAPGERCASTSNRNFEGRQGAGGRTHLVSPAMAAAAAVMGHFADVRELGIAS